MKVVVPVTQFQEGAFPAVCALTGEPATTSRRLLVVRRGTFGDARERRRRMFGRGMSRIAGTIPLTERAARRTAVIERTRAALAVVAIAGFVVGVFTSFELWLSAAGLAVVLGVSLLFTVGGELNRTGQTVTLLHVHPKFAEAVGTRSPGSAERS